MRTAALTCTPCSWRSAATGRCIAGVYRGVYRGVYTGRGTDAEERRYRTAQEEKRRYRTALSVFYAFYRVKRPEPALPGYRKALYTVLHLLHRVTPCGNRVTPFTPFTPFRHRVENMPVKHRSL